MTVRMLDNVAWYLDPAASDEAVPGIWHSFVSCLCAALAAKGDPVDPAQVMGDTGWAFRILAHKEMCPSAMSVFDFTSVLTESAEQVGYRCQYVSRYWHEGEAELERRDKAHALILAAIDRGDPPIVWDLPPVPEWGLIVGYDTAARVYHTLGVDQQPATVPFDKLGQREIPILSVTILGEPNGRSEQERRLRGLRLAVQHGRHNEWCQRPDYDDGPKAFDVWADAIEAGFGSSDGEDFGQYYAGHWAGARAYASAYLADMSSADGALRPVESAYARVAADLLQVYSMTGPDGYADDVALRREVARLVRQAGQHERKALDCLEHYLAAEVRATS